ncbi:MAG: aldehyde dehydrogenase family protein [Paracoccus sp. (in: a-proteobacteria)]|nr:aldehyde dehydrogenase family protein [Paracoccus sp. (in: a-proteobacteria)]
MAGRPIDACGLIWINTHAASLIYCSENDGGLLPARLVNMVPGDGLTTGSATSGTPDIAKVGFTGSTGFSQAIMGNIAHAVDGTPIAASGQQCTLH